MANEGKSSNSFTSFRSWSVQNPDRSIVADTKTATLIFPANFPMAWVRLSPPALCPTSITCQWNPSTRLSWIYTDNQLGLKNSSNANLFGLGERRHEVHQGLVVVIEREDRVSVGGVDPGALQVDAGDPVARVLHEGPNLVPAPCPSAKPVDEHEVLPWRPPWLRHLRHLSHGKNPAARIVYWRCGRAGVRLRSFFRLYMDLVGHRREEKHN